MQKKALCKVKVIYFYENSVNFMLLNSKTHCKTAKNGLILHWKQKQNKKKSVQERI